MANTNKLNRSLGLRLVVVIVIGNIIGSGVYKKIAPMATDLPSPMWILVCWIVAGVITLFGALSNAEVAGLLADTGGEYAYYQTIYNKFFAFLFGWSLFTVIQTAAISSLAYVFAESLRGVIPLPELFPGLAGINVGHLFYPFADLSTKLVAVVLIVILTWLNARGIRAGAYFSTLILALVFIGIFLIVVFGLASPASNISRIVSPASVPISAVTFSGFFSAMLAAFWAYQGWASIGYIGGEVKEAHRNLPRGITIGVFIIIALYLLVNATYLSLLSVPQLSGVHKAGNQIAAVVAVRQFWGAGGAAFISFLIMLTTLGCTNATVLSSSRTYYAMAQEGLFFRKAGQLNKAQAPAVSLLYQGIWACILVFSGTFDQLTDMIVFAVFLFYGATTIGVFILRKKMPDRHRPYKVWGYPVVPALVVLFCAFLFLNTLFARPREAAIGIVLMLTGIPMYYWFRRKNKISQPANTGDGAEKQ